MADRDLRFFVILRRYKGHLGDLYGDIRNQGGERITERYKEKLSIPAGDTFPRTRTATLVPLYAFREKATQLTLNEKNSTRESRERERRDRKRHIV